MIYTCLQLRTPSPTPSNTPSQECILNHIRLAKRCYTRETLQSLLPLLYAKWGSLKGHGIKEFVSWWKESYGTAPFDAWFNGAAGTCTVLMSGVQFISCCRRFSRGWRCRCGIVYVVGDGDVASYV